MLRKLHHLPFRDSADQVQMQTALPLLGLWIRGRPGEGVGDQGESGQASAANHEQQFPIGEQFFQRSTPCKKNVGKFDRGSQLPATEAIPPVGHQPSLLPFIVPNGSKLCEVRKPGRAPDCATRQSRKPKRPRCRRQ